MQALSLDVSEPRQRLRTMEVEVRGTHPSGSTVLRIVSMSPPFLWRVRVRSEPAPRNLIAMDEGYKRKKMQAAWPFAGPITSCRRGQMVFET
jgi:hypothetical protein